MRERGRRSGILPGVALAGMVFAGVLAWSPAPALDASGREEGAALIAAVNRLREEYALPVLAIDPALQKLSQDYAMAMAASDCLAQSCAGRGKVSDRARDRGYDFLVIGEALAGGPREVEQVVQLWMMSEPHRAILLNGEVRQIGAGHIYWPNDRGRADYGHYWVLTVSLRP